MSDKKGSYRQERANLMAVAKYAGVSAMTVSRVLNQPGKVAEATRKKVQAAVDALGYVPNLAANTLRRERSGVIVALVPTLENSVFSDTVQGISNALEQEGCQLLLGCSSYSPEREEKLVRALLGHRPDGIILTGTLHTAETHKLLESARIPVVEMWDIAADHIDMAVGFDNFAAGHDIASHMIRCGYESLGYVATSPEHEIHENRAAKRSKGIYAAVAEAGIGMPARQNVRNPLDIADSGVIAADFVVANPGLDAIICANEIIGVGAIAELQNRGWQIPDQIAVCGIGDANIAALVTPGLTTVQFYGQDIGKRAAELILDRLSGQQAADGKQDVGFRIVSRASTAEKPS